MALTSELLGLTPQDLSAAAFTAGGEAAPGKDIGGVLQTILARKALNPGASIASLVKAPQQFVANDPYSVGQVTDPGFGAKIYGNKYNQAMQILQNPNLMSGYLQAGQGATSFRGQSLLANKHPDDIMFSPNGNFYFDKHPNVANQLIQKLGQPAPLGVPSAGGGQPQQSETTQPQQIASQPQTDPVTFANSYATQVKDVLKAMATPRDYGGLSQAFDLNAPSVQAAQQNTIPIASPNAIIGALMSAGQGSYV
jgi:hypothetical protein